MSILARFRIACGVLACLAVCAEAAAQFGPIIELPPNLPPVVMLPPLEGYPPTTAPTAAGQYFAPMAWTQTLATAARFVVLSNFNSDAVLDRETGLVWTRKPMQLTNGAVAADNICRYQAAVGGRKGWRLPTSSELLSLVDMSRPNVPGEPRFPAGHPFLLPPAGDFPEGLVHWAADAPFAGGQVMDFFTSGQPFLEPGRMVVNLSFGYAAELGAIPQYSLGVLCVRTGSALAL